MSHNNSSSSVTDESIEPLTAASSNGNMLIIETLQLNNITGTDKHAAARQDRLAFFLYGLINNFVYVIFLSAAHDLISRHQSSGSSMNEGAILLADILPALFVKSIAPHLMHKFSYRSRIYFCSLLTITSLFIVSSSSYFVISDSSSSSASAVVIWLKMFGIVLGSAASGFGEITFLALLSFFEPQTVGSWSSGTGAAGIFSSLSYMFLTSVLGVSFQVTLLMVGVMPLCMIVVYERIMSKPHLSKESSRYVYVPVLTETTIGGSSDISVEISADCDDDLSSRPTSGRKISADQLSVRDRLTIIKPLVWPYMIPLFIVFAAEYTINQGIMPVLLFPLTQTPFTQIRDHYVTYQCLYQLGVFISRSSIQYYQVPDILSLSILQVLILGLLLLQALTGAIHPIYAVFLIIFCEGLLGGGVYVNAFFRIRREVEPVYQEFALSVCALADTLGISVAGIISLIIRPLLCKWQQDRDYDLCGSS